VKHVNYDDPATLVEALKGQEALIITMAVTAPPDSQEKLIEAAAAANVAFVLPNTWGIDSDNAEMGKDTFIAKAQLAAREKIEKLGKSAWIGVTCGFWYEYSLAAGDVSYGFDFQTKTVTLYDEGKVRMNTSTWPQCGRAVAKLLALPLHSDDGSPCLNDYKNKTVYISSFNIGQRDMLESVERVTGEKWEVKYQPVKERYAEGVKEFQGGSRSGFGKLLYARPFYPDGSGEFEKTHGLQNDVLGLPKEDLDEYTKIAFDMVKKAIEEGRYPKF
jgi:hypothetical protein